MIKKKSFMSVFFDYTCIYKMYYTNTINSGLKDHTFKSLNLDISEMKKKSKKKSTSISR